MTTCLLSITATILILVPISSHSYSENSTNDPKLSIQEATIKDIQIAFQQNKLTSRELVLFYLKKIRRLNRAVRAVIEVNRDALAQADEADKRRKQTNKKPGGSVHGMAVRGWLDGIPILLKDNIGTKDKLNTSAGSFALLGSIVPRDAWVVERLRKAGAIILGKASMSEWANFRSTRDLDGWSARGGQGHNPYNISVGPCGSSSGSAIAVAANMVSVSLGTETDGSILCPSSRNSVVGIKPTIGLTSRSGVIPISPRQDTIGPICRTVADATYVLDAIVGFDPYDSEATRQAEKYIPKGGYAQHLKLDGLKGKRLGIVRNPFFDSIQGSPESTVFKQHFHTLRQRGAVLVDNVEIHSIDRILSVDEETTALLAEFKLALNSYLKGLVASPVRSLADVIEFNNKFAKKEKIKEYGQEIFLQAEATNGIGPKEKKALSQLAEWNLEFEKVMEREKLDAIITPESSFATVFAIGGYPGISVPAGYDNNGVPFGICFGGLRGDEPKLIEIAYAFEQATKVRKPPVL